MVQERDLKEEFVRVNLAFEVGVRIVLLYY